ncbi:phage holin family protein [uncultured Roseovarius sp.]|uniref:phage holin family protein n=1 Tax=uncultured Roseovarius sp. TaxID=293344 RepID=UPI0025E348B2|nr:phage holin family protein [uncultured Roseovarius sp.]
MIGMFSAMGDRLRRAARATAFSVMGVVFGLVGLGFLTVALWIVLAAQESALVAYAAIGALYVVLGFCLMALGAQKGQSPDNTAPEAPERTRQDPTKDPIVQVAEGFAVGMQAGKAMRENRD